MMKKTICLVTNWYPTKKNPYAGLFFKEQAFLVSEEFDFIVFRYKEQLRKVPWNMRTALILTMIRKSINQSRKIKHSILKERFMRIIGVA